MNNSPFCEAQTNNLTTDELIHYGIIPEWFMWACTEDIEDDLENANSENEEHEKTIKYLENKIEKLSI